MSFIRGGMDRFGRTTGHYCKTKTPQSRTLSKIAFMTRIVFGVALLFGFASCHAQDKPLNQHMDFESYDPPSTLVAEEHHPTRAKFPFIDIHNHQGDMSASTLATLVTDMDKLNMAVMNNLSGKGWGGNGSEHLYQSLESIKKNYPNRFILFTNVDFDNIDDADWTERTVAQLEKDIKAGAKGLKIYKDLGLRVTDKNGKRVAIDDPRIDPVWEKCGELGVPVLIHAADPKAFWQPIDEKNERWLELKLHPGRRHDTDPIKWETVIAQQHNIFKKHPNTKFINAHLGWYGNDLKKLGQLMDQFPNMYTEIGAVISDLGRQPRAAKAFLTKYQDRVLFGKDSWEPKEYETYFRVLETEDEYFPYHKRYHAFWKMYGLGLPDDLLKKIYYKNAMSLVSGIDKSLFPD
jgi:predicted TIM-barrel fold metal-dependent hydrolase